jgi:hypothetical protein
LPTDYRVFGGVEGQQELEVMVVKAMVVKAKMKELWQWW